MKMNIIHITLLMLFLLTAVTAGYQWYAEWTASRTAAKAFRELQVSVSEPSVQKETDMKSAEKSAYETYVGLYEQNPDFYGWLRIDGTAVDYPVMYAPNRHDWYLRRDFCGESSRHGIPYLEEGCVPGLSNNLVVYGHNMKDGSMFHDLLNYADRDFWANHQIIHFDTLEGFGTYQVMLVFCYDAEWDTFQYHTFTDMEEDDFEEFLAECALRSLYDTGITAEYGGELLTLSTCEYSHANGRFIVVAKRITED